MRDAVGMLGFEAEPEKLCAGMSGWWTYERGWDAQYCRASTSMLSTRNSSERQYARLAVCTSSAAASRSKWVREVSIGCVFVEEGALMRLSRAETTENVEVVR